MIYFFALRCLIKNDKAQLLEIIIEGQTGSKEPRSKLRGIERQKPKI